MMYYAKQKYCLSEQAMKTTSSSKKPQRRRGRRVKEEKGMLLADVVNGN